MTTLALGDLQVTGLTDIDRFDIPLKTLLPAADPEKLRGIEWLGPKILKDGILRLKIRSWLLRLGGRVILIDTCVGAHKERPNWPDWHRRDGASWLAALSSEGLGPEDVDIVMCTHLHADHVGWNTQLIDGRWVPTFPNARYICARTEYDFWEQVAADGGDKHGSFADSVLPVMETGKMDLVDDGWELARGLELHSSPGHSPGHMCIHARHGCGATFAGDVIHSPIQLAFPELSSAFCSDPDQACTTRRRLLESIAGTDHFLIPAHFPNPGWVNVDRDGNGFKPS